MVAIDRVGHVYPSVHLQEMLKLAQKPAPLATPTQYTSVVPNDPVANVMNGDATQKVTPEQFGLTNNPSLEFATPGGGFVQVFGPLKTPAYYKPPAPPAPGPVIIKEVRPPQAPAPPPLFVRIQPPPPREQAPLVIREAPPPRPKHVPTTHLTKVLPAIPAPPPNVQVRNAPDQATVEKTLNELGLTSLLR